MVDILAPEERSENMRRIRGKHTAPELSVRGLVRRMGLRFRLNYPGLPGKPDLVFLRKKKAIFVHGCFWHKHDARRCRIARMPKSRVRYWAAKLERNARKDKENLSALRRLGWKPLVVWECDIERNLETVSSRIRRFLQG